MRNKLAINGLLLPTRRPISFAFKPYVSCRLLYPSASSMVLSCDLCTFSTRPKTAASLSVTSLTKQGIVLSPAALLARSLLSPAIN